MITRSRLIAALVGHKFDPLQILLWLELRGALRNCESLLDIGCGPHSFLRILRPGKLVGIDAYKPAVDAAQAHSTHHEVVLGDIKALNKLFEPGQFDGCVALDVIEHLPKEAGLKFLRDMERIASKAVVLTTPNGFLPQRHADRDDLQEHLSGWEAAEMRALGYQVVGLLGPKRLRGEYHALRYRPKVFWALVSLCAQVFWTRRRPESAAALLAVRML